MLIIIYSQLMIQYVQQYVLHRARSTHILMVAQLLMRENNLHMSTTVEKALDFYIYHPKDSSKQRD